MKVLNNLSGLTLLYLVITANIIGTLVGQYYSSGFNPEILTGVVIGIPLWLVFMYLPFTLIFFGFRYLLRVGDSKVGRDWLVYIYDNIQYLIFIYFILGLFNISFPFDSLMRLSFLLFDL